MKALSEPRRTAGTSISGFGIDTRIAGCSDYDALECALGDEVPCGGFGRPYAGADRGEGLRGRDGRIVTTGLVATALEQDLLGELRRRGIVVWLDSTSAYSEFVDELLVRSQSHDCSCPVISFKGSFLQLVRALEPHGTGPA